MVCKYARMLRARATLKRAPRSCENNILWRGHFNATGAETAANLSINGGTGTRRSVLNNFGC